MKTSLDRVWACGDITTFDGKLKLIATGFAEAAIAVAQAVHHIRPGHEDPAQVLDEHRRARAPSRARPERRAAWSRTCARADPVLARLIDEIGGAAPERARPRAAASHYGALVRAIVGQQLSVERGARDLRAPARALRRPPADARRRSWPTTPRSCAPPSASRARRSAFLRSLAEHVARRRARARPPRASSPTRRSSPSSSPSRASARGARTCS